MTTTLDPTTGTVWRAARGPVIVVLLVLLVGIVTALLRPTYPAGLLDPEAVDDAGGRALARLLTAEGVQVRRVTTIDEAATAARPDTTLLIARPALLIPAQLDRLRGKADELVLISPGKEALDALAPGIDTGEATRVRVRRPGCTLPAAQAAGAARIGGQLYTASGEAARCYAVEEGRVEGEAALIRRPAGGGVVTVIGTAAPLTNGALDEDGNAALAMRLLGQHRTLVWYVPSLADPALAPDESLWDLLPAGWKFAFLQVAIGVGLLALWRARRLGPVVPEPLPVVVRAAETVEGRARLYRRARATDRAAAALRSAALHRILPAVGLPARASAEQVVDAVARRTGRDAPEVAAILYGPPPPDDPALVRLADDLDSLQALLRR